MEWKTKAEKEHCRKQISDPNGVIQRHFDFDAHNNDDPIAWLKHKASKILNTTLQIWSVFDG